MIGEAWDPGTGEKGLSGLVRLSELMGLAGLLVLKEPDAPLATEQEKQREVKVAGIDSLEHRHIGYCHYTCDYFPAVCYLCFCLCQYLWMSYSCVVPLIHLVLSKTLSGCAYEPVPSAKKGMRDIY